MSLGPLLAHWREKPQRTWSVVVTVFGDAIVPRGGSVWLATLVDLLAALGVDAGAVRTAMSRLVADGWTQRRRVSRSSAYELTPKGVATFTAAADLIYAAGPPDWDGVFQLVLQPPDRAAMARAGFAQAIPGLWVATGAAPPPAGAIARWRQPPIRMRPGPWWRRPGRLTTSPPPSPASSPRSAPCPAGLTRRRSRRWRHAP